MKRPTTQAMLADIAQSLLVSIDTTPERFREIAAEYRRDADAEAQAGRHDNATVLREQADLADAGAQLAGGARAGRPSGRGRSVGRGCALRLFRVWSPELGESLSAAQTIGAETAEAAALIAHRSISDESGAQTDGIYCVRDDSGVEQWVSVAPIVTYSARQVAPRCDRCGAEASHDVHNGRERAVCAEHAHDYWPHPTPMRSDYATPRRPAPGEPEPRRR